MDPGNRQKPLLRLPLSGRFGSRPPPHPHHGSCLHTLGPWTATAPFGSSTVTEDRFFSRSVGEQWFLCITLLPLSAKLFTKEDECCNFACIPFRSSKPPRLFSYWFGSLLTKGPGPKYSPPPLNPPSLFIAATKIVVFHVGSLLAFCFLVFKIYLMQAPFFFPLKVARS